MRKVLLILSVFMLTLPLSAQKKNSPEYVAKRKATILALDSLIHLASMSDAKVFVASDMLEKLIADQRKEFKNDPVLLSAIARSIATKANQMDSACVLYGELKRLHPQYVQGYIDYANLLHSQSIMDGYDGPNATNIQRAKQQIDSAKQAIPTLARPYATWVAMRAPYINRSGVMEEIREEIENWNKNFPDSSAYEKAGSLLMAAKKEEIMNVELQGDFDGGKLKDMAVEYFNKAGINTIDIAYLAMLSNYYYEEARYGSAEDGKRNFLKGAEIAAIGLQRGDVVNDRYLKRRALWNYALASKYASADSMVFLADSALHYSELLMQKSDSLDLRDYIATATAMQSKGLYDDAVSMYHKALSMPGLSFSSGLQRYGNDSVQIYNSIFMCDTIQHNYKKAISTMKDLIRIKCQHTEDFPLNDLNRLAFVYQKLAQNVVDYDYDERYAAWETQDSIYAVIQNEVDKGQLDLTTSTSYFIYQRFSVRYQIDKMDPARSELKTFDMAHLFWERVEPQSQKSDLEKNYLRLVSRWLTQASIANKDNGGIAKYGETWLRYETDMDPKVEKWLRNEIKKYGRR